MGFPNPEKYTLEDLAKRWDKSVDYVKDLIRQKKLESVSCLYRTRGTPGDKSIGIRFQTYIQQAEVDKFEKVYNLRSIPEQPALTKTKYMSTELRVAVAAYTALYCGNNLPEFHLGHKRVIRKWLSENSSKDKLSKSAIDRITTVVNPNQIGGAPRQN